MKHCPAEAVKPAVVKAAVVHHGRRAVHVKKTSIVRNRDQGSQDQRRLRMRNRDQIARIRIGRGVKSLALMKYHQIANILIGRVLTSQGLINRARTGRATINHVRISPGNTAKTVTRVIPATVKAKPLSRKSRLRGSRPQKEKDHPIADQIAGVVMPNQHSSASQKASPVGVSPIVAADLRTRPSKASSVNHAAR